MDSKPRSKSQRRHPLREPLNRVYSDYPTFTTEDKSTKEYVDVKVNFYLSKDMNCIRWVYCWAGSPVQHCQIEIDGLIHNIDAHVPSHWMCKDLYIGDKPGGSYEIAKELVFKVPKDKIQWDKIRAVSEGYSINIWKTLFWGIVRHSRGGAHIPKPSPDCVSISKQILGVLGIYGSGELPWEFYESLVEHYNPEIKSYRSFK